MKKTTILKIIVIALPLILAAIANHIQHKKDKGIEMVHQYELTISDKARG